MKDDIIVYSFILYLFSISMNKKFLAPIGAVALFFSMALLSGCSGNDSTSQPTATLPNVQAQNTEPALANAPAKEDESDLAKAPAREIEIESFTKIVDGKYFPQFSPKEITVKKGEAVRLKINATSGKHDFKIDELNVYSDTPVGQVTVIDFTPDKAGKFVYYCTKPKHRDLGQWGTLTVTEE